MVKAKAKPTAKVFEFLIDPALGRSNWDAVRLPDVSKVLGWHEQRIGALERKLEKSYARPEAKNRLRQLLRTFRRFSLSLSLCRLQRNRSWLLVGALHGFLSKGAVYGRTAGGQFTLLSDADVRELRDVLQVNDELYIVPMPAAEVTV